jgi:GNAT superfamily N-acetyltransferase
MKFDTEEIRFKKFDIEDYNAVKELWKLSGLPIKDKGRDSLEKIQEELKRGIAHFILAEFESQLIGAVLITHDGRKGWINRLAVHPNFRQKGIAGLIVKKVEDYLYNIGIEIIACLIEDYNKESLEVFQKLGYIEFPNMHYLTKRKHPEV